LQPSDLPAPVPLASGLSDERLAEIRKVFDSWPLRDVSNELLDEIVRTRSDAALGAAVREALAEKAAFIGIVGPLAVGRDGDVCYLHPDHTCSETAATKALAALLSRVPEERTRT
jgi:hypothetical protein